MLKKVFASGIAIVAIAGLVTAPAMARHKHYKHLQTIGMSSKNGAGPGMAGTGPGSQAGGAQNGGTGASSANSTK
jgi:hypothetical protein